MMVARYDQCGVAGWNEREIGGEEEGAGGEEEEGLTPHHRGRYNNILLVLILFPLSI